MINWLILLKYGLVEKCVRIICLLFMLECY